MEGLAFAARCNLNKRIFPDAVSVRPSEVLPNEKPTRRETVAANEITAQPMPADENSSAPSGDADKLQQGLSPPRLG